ncbi:hypothetical protein AU074_29370 [Pseudomonas sp. ATCC PTA-122608]|nr:hypothetical protein AU074_29370 [Pseudomonas sp. ATCC PTA-122608]
MKPSPLFAGFRLALRVADERKFLHPFNPLTRRAALRKILADVIIVELTAFDELETMAGVKTIRGAFFEGTYFNRECSRIRYFENLSEHSRADP